jgi:hypothetical protein
MLSCKRLCERVLSRVWGFGRLEKDAVAQTTQHRYSLFGSRKMQWLKQRSTGIRLNTVVAGPEGECKEDGDL